MDTDVFIGVDWHKKTSTWVGMNKAREVLFKEKIGCTPHEVGRVLSRYAPESTHLAVEPVCGWRWFASLCEERGCDVRIANPRRLRQIAETTKKTDENDAHTLAELLSLGYLPEAYRAPGDIHALRVLVRHRAALISITTSIKCRIQSTCTALGAHETASQPLHKAGREAVQESNHEELKEWYRLLEGMQPFIRSIEKRIETEAKENETIKLLMTVPGIGIITGTAIYAEVGDFARFHSPGALASYAGLIPRERSSGERRMTYRLSKEGSKVLRYSLVEAAMRVRNVSASTHLYAYYAGLVSRGKSKKEARVALAHKVLTCLWYMVKRHTAYNDRALIPAQSRVNS
jgi:transposase